MESSDEPTCRCHQNPFIGALGIQQPVILGEPQIDQRQIKTGWSMASTYNQISFLIFLNSFLRFNRKRLLKIFYEDSKKKVNQD